MINHPQFVMSMFANKEALLTAKLEYYQNMTEALEKERVAYNELAQLFILCDSSNPEKIILDTVLYNAAVLIIEKQDKINE